MISWFQIDETVSSRASSVVTVINSGSLHNPQAAGGSQAANSVDAAGPAATDVDYPDAALEEVMFSGTSAATDCPSSSAAVTHTLNWTQHCEAIQSKLAMELKQQVAAFMDEFCATNLSNLNAEMPVANIEDFVTWHIGKVSVEPIRLMTPVVAGPAAPTAFGLRKNELMTKLLVMEKNLDHLSEEIMVRKTKVTRPSIASAEELRFKPENRAQISGESQVVEIKDNVSDEIISIADDSYTTQELIDNMNNISGIAASASESDEMSDPISSLLSGSSEFLANQCSGSNDSVDLNQHTSASEQQMEPADLHLADHVMELQPAGGFPTLSQEEVNTTTELNQLVCPMVSQTYFFSQDLQDIDLPPLNAAQIDVWSKYSTANLMTPGLGIDVVARYEEVSYVEGQVGLVPIDLPSISSKATLISVNETVDVSVVAAELLSPNLSDTSNQPLNLAAEDTFSDRMVINDEAPQSPMMPRQNNRYQPVSNPKNTPALKSYL